MSRTRKLLKELDRAKLKSACWSARVAALEALLAVSAGNSASTPMPTSLVISSHHLYRGMQARVAAELGVTRATVCKVIKGKTKSSRVTKALAREAQRIEMQIARLYKEAA